MDVFRSMASRAAAILVLISMLTVIGGAPAPAVAQESAETLRPAATQATVPSDPAAGEAASPAHDATEEHPKSHPEPPHVSLWWALPFAVLLLCVASVPAYDHHLWEKIYPYVAVGLGLVTATYYLFFHPELAAARYAWLHEMREYVSFILLLGSLYTVSGGIVIGISRKATPITNCVLLLVGGVIANIVGTTGAAMLLIRPFIRMNREHLKAYHIVFFIFIVANCGGALTPIGDPPLFMGFLKGVPFFWTARALWPMWAVVVGLLLVVFFIIDEIDYRRITRDAPDVLEGSGPGVSIFGFQNFIFVGLILVAVFQRSMFEYIDLKQWGWIAISREVLMFVAAAASKLTTKPFIYERNEFTWGPIREVAILFVGIFSTMVPALNWLAYNADRLPLRQPGHYYYITGVLSSVLDNAPTYLVFLEVNQSKVQMQYGDKIQRLMQLAEEHQVGEVPAVPTAGDRDVINAYKVLVDYHRHKVAAGTLTETDARIAMTLANPQMSMFLVAISVGAVFFGAATYIGNGPNFMVKSIAEAQGVRMPTFFAFVVKYSVPILAPILVVVWYVFFYLMIGV